MEFVITDCVPVTHVPNSFEVIVSTFVDNENEDFVVGPFVKDQDEDALEDLIETLGVINHACDGLDRNPDYSSVPEFNVWFGSLGVSDENYGKYLTFQRRWGNLMWPYDFNSRENKNYGGYNIFYYDGNLVKYAVETR